MFNWDRLLSLPFGRDEGDESLRASEFGRCL